MKIFEVMNRRTFLKTATFAILSLMNHLPEHVRAAEVNSTPTVFSLSIQKKILKKVLQLKNIEFDKTKQIPKVVNATNVDPRIFLETWGFEVDTTKYEVNHYHWKRNLIIMANNSKINNLAHEYVHYIQYTYEKIKLNNQIGGIDEIEMDAIRIQNYFK